MKIKKHVDDSEKFIIFFRQQLKVIDAAQFNEKGNLYKKVLLVGVIDTLSKTIYPRKGNRDRFVSFIRHFAQWKECERVSLPHLVRLLEKVPDTDFSELRKFALSRFAQWEEGKEIYLDNDPDYSEVQKLWPKEKEYTKDLSVNNTHFSPAYDGSSQL